MSNVLVLDIHDWIEAEYGPGHGSGWKTGNGNGIGSSSGLSNTAGVGRGLADGAGRFGKSAYRMIIGSGGGSGNGIISHPRIRIHVR